MLGALAAGPARAEYQTSGLLEMFEMHEGSGDDHFLFNATFVTGGERHGATLMVEGGSDVGPRVDEVTTQALYTLNPQGNQQLLIGVRHDFRPGGDLTHAALGANVTIGSWLSAEHYLYLSRDGDVTGAAQAIVYLQASDAVTVEPRLQLGWAAHDIAREETGAGLSDLTASVRVRRQIGPVFNLYGGVIHERLLGRTLAIARAGGDRGHTTRLVLGIGASF